MDLNGADFSKNAPFMSNLAMCTAALYSRRNFSIVGVICSPRAAPASERCFFYEISFYASFEAYSYVFTAQTTCLWKTACDSLAQTHERYRYTDHEY